MNKKSLNITPFVAIDKIKNWCAYQERSQNETRVKLLEYGLNLEEADNIITELIAENYLNEERFAIAFTSGKFRIKHWGRKKIKAALKQHKISDYCIKKALLSIDEEVYHQTMIKVIEKKLRLLTSGDRRKKYYSCLSYLVSKGFESDLVIEQLNVILDADSE